MPVVDEDAFNNLESSALPSLGDRDSLSEVGLWDASHGPSWPLFSPALAVLHPHWAGIWMSGGVGISFPYVTMFPQRKRDAASQGHISGIPLRGCFISEADAGSTARAFMLPGRLCHPPVKSRPSIRLITHVIQSVVTLKAFP